MQEHSVPENEGTTSIASFAVHATLLSMPHPLRPPDLPPLTQAAEGLMRRRWSVAEIAAMVRAEIIPAEERFELIGGEALPLLPASPAHERLERALSGFWTGRLPADLIGAPRPTLRLDADTFLLPDFAFVSAAHGVDGLVAATTLLAVEIADESLAFDLRRKTGVYAAHEVGEVWVIDVNRLETHVFREPSDGEYEACGLVTAGEPLALPFAPGVVLRLADLTRP